MAERFDLLAQAFGEHAHRSLGRCVNCAAGAPVAAKRRAAASPRPLLAPVMTITLPSIQTHNRCLEKALKDPFSVVTRLSTYPAMRDLDPVFNALSRSAFRSRFALGPREQADLDCQGLRVMRAHAERFVRERLACAEPANDGKQTPMRNHPVFIAQHATATCCRSCLEKWHGISAHRDLSEAEQAYVCRIIMTWLASRHDPSQVAPPPQRDLFDGPS